MHRRVSHAVDRCRVAAVVPQIDDKLYEAVLRGDDESCAALQQKHTHKKKQKGDGARVGHRKKKSPKGVLGRVCWVGYLGIPVPTPRYMIGATSILIPLPEMWLS